jgi:hypothetical protein
MGRRVELVWGSGQIDYLGRGVAEVEVDKVFAEVSWCFVGKGLVR